MSKDKIMCFDNRESNSIDLTNTVDAKNQLGGKKYLRFGEVKAHPRFCSPVIRWRGTPQKPISVGAVTGDWRRQNVKMIMFIKRCGLSERNIPICVLHCTMRILGEKYE